MEKLRTCHFRPYRKGMGPTFTLHTLDAGERHEGAFCRRSYLGYELIMRDNGKRVVLFKGNDIGLAPGCPIDSDRSIAAVMGWLTLRPGDTDSDFFAKYTPEQLAFCEQHAEALSMDVIYRFGED